MTDNQNYPMIFGDHDWLMIPPDDQREPEELEPGPRWIAPFNPVVLPATTGNPVTDENDARLRYMARTGQQVPLLRQAVPPMPTVPYPIYAVLLR